MTTPPTKKSDLPVRAASAVVMLAVAGTALWLGGTVWTVFVAAVALGVLWEWWGLVLHISARILWRTLFSFAGFVYVASASAMLVVLREDPFGFGSVATLLSAVIATDVGAYFAGRTIGGPKIAPAISPSKTWAGLGGGILGASLSLIVAALVIDSGFRSMASDVLTEGLGDSVRVSYELLEWNEILANSLIGGLVIAVIAQAGDFFQSWLKRRAGVKDSGALIPGHGGLFDRVDGLLAVLFAGVCLIIAALFYQALFGLVKG